MAIKPAPPGMRALMRTNTNGTTDPDVVPMSEEERVFSERLKLYSERVTVAKDLSQPERHTPAPLEHVPATGEQPKRLVPVFPTRKSLLVACLAASVVVVLPVLGAWYAGRWHPAWTDVDQIAAASKRLTELSDDDPRAALGFMNLGALLNAQGQYAEAEAMFNKSLNIRLRFSDDNILSLATVYDNLGATQSLRGKYADAIVSFEKALAIRRKMIGENNREVVNGYNNLGAVLSAQGRHDDAKLMFAKAVAILHNQNARPTETIDKESTNTLVHVESFEIQQFHANTKQFLGTIGILSYSCHENDNVKISAHLSAPGYSYLIALNPDGSMQLCPKSEEHTSPKKSTEISYPREENRFYGLTDGTGLQAFVLVASHKPLPPFDTWLPRTGIAWKPIKDSNSWLFDGQRFTLLESPTRSIDRDQRLTSPTTAARPPALLDAIVKYLKQQPDVDAVQAIAFPVLPVPK